MKSVISFLILFIIANTYVSVCAPSRNIKVWVPDQHITCISQCGNGIYLGGAFTKFTALTGGGACYSMPSGKRIESFPITDGSVLCAASDSNGGWFIGGTFTKVGSYNRKGIAHIFSDNSVDTSIELTCDSIVNALVFNGSQLFIGGVFGRAGYRTHNNLACYDASSGLMSRWQPAVNGKVMAILLKDSLIYIGGNFTRIGDSTRNYIGCVDTASGNPTSWNPNADNVVYAMLLNDTNIFVGGKFRNIGGSIRYSIACIGKESGKATSWNIKNIVSDSGYTPTIQVMAMRENSLYVGGQFIIISDSSRFGLACLDMTNAQVLNWKSNIDKYSTIFALALHDSTLFIGGNISQVGVPTVRNIASISSTSGLPVVWRVGEFSLSANNTVQVIDLTNKNLFIGGSFSTTEYLNRRYLACLDESTDTFTQWNPNPNGPVNCMAINDGKIYIGGNFTFVGNRARNYFACIDTSTYGNLTVCNPDADNAIQGISIDNGLIYTCGSFTIIGGRPRNRIAAIDTFGDATPWDPNANQTVSSICALQGRVYAAGSFTQIGDSSRRVFAGIDGTTGIVTNLFPCCEWNRIYTLAKDNNELYVCGAFYYDRGYRQNFICLDSSGDTTSFDPDITSPATINGVAANSTNIYLCGKFTDKIGDSLRTNLACLDKATGKATSWNADSVGGIGNTLYANERHLYIGGSNYSALNANYLMKLDAYHPSTTHIMAPKTTSAFLNSNVQLSNNNRVRYSLLSNSKVQIAIFDLLGNNVFNATFFQEKGLHTFALPVNSLRHMQYVVRFKAGNYEKTIRFYHLR